jgi:hypothetical protein
MSKVKDSEGEPVQRGLANLERRAIAQGWDVPTAKRKRIVKRLLGYLDPKSVDGKLAKPRYVIAAFRALASADLRQQALDLQERMIDSGQANETSLGALLRMAAQYDGDSAGPTT